MPRIRLAATMMIKSSRAALCAAELTTSAGRFLGQV